MITLRHVQRISTAGSDRGTGYNMSRRIVRRGDALLIGWLDAPADVGAPSHAMLGVCDAATGELRHSFPLGAAKDNHCGPALGMDPDGRVHAVIGGHGTPFQYRWSDAPEKPEAWSTPELLGPKDTYPALTVDAAGTLHLAHREGGERWQLWYRRKKAGATWEAPVPLAISPTPGYNHFMQSCSIGPDGTLHITLQFHYTETGRNLDAWGHAAAHLQSIDGGNTWTHEGNRLDRPLTIEAMQPICATERGSDGYGLSKSNHVIQDDGIPCFVCSMPGHPSGVLCHCVKGNWHQLDLGEALNGLKLGHGGSTWLSRDAAGRLYLAFYADPRGGAWGFGTAGMELFLAVLTSTGGKLRLSQLTDGASATQTAHWLPALEKWDWTRSDLSFDDGHWLMYTRGKNSSSTTEAGRNRNAAKTEIFLGRIDRAAAGAEANK